MAQALPLTKLGTLLIKTLAKPVSKRVKHEFSRYDTTKNMLIWIGQTSHTLSSRMTIWSAGYTVRSIKPLEQEKALAAGADMVGEGFLFLVSAEIVIWEYNRSRDAAKAKEAEKHAQTKAEAAALRAKLKALDLRLKAVENVVKHNAESLLNLGGTKYVPPEEKALVNIVEDDEEDSDDDSTAPSSSSEKVVVADAHAEQAQATQPAATDEKATESKPWWKIW